jgi:hypothetical protein
MKVEENSPEYNNNNNNNNNSVDVSRRFLTFTCHEVKEESSCTVYELC